MGILRVEKDKNYFAASNEPFNDERLSWEARGVMGYLLSKPDGWQVKSSDLIRRGPAGEHKVLKVLKELEEHKYLERHRLKDNDGKWYWVSVIYETPSIPRLSRNGLPMNGKPRDIVSTESTSTDLISTEEEEGPPNIFDLYEDTFGLMTGSIGDRLTALEEDYALYWIKDAFGIAKENDAKSLKYVETVLSRWTKEGKDNGYKQRKKKKGVDVSAFDQVREEMGDG